MVTMMMVLSNGSCPKKGRLKEAVVRGSFRNDGDERRMLEHLLALCSCCLQEVTDLVHDDSAQIRLGTLFRCAQRNFHRLPVALAVGRTVVFLRGTDADATLPPMIRYLLRSAGSTGCGGFFFGWLLIEESRFLCFNSLGGNVERWHPLVDTFTMHSSSKQNRELGILIRIYQGGEFLAAGDLNAAKKCLVKVHDDAGRCHEFIRGAALELEAHIAREEGQFPMARTLYRRALDLFEEGRIEKLRVRGRGAETWAEIGLTYQLQGQSELAMRALDKASQSIPWGTDCDLRATICRFKDTVEQGRVVANLLEGQGDIRHMYSAAGKEPS